MGDVFVYPFNWIIPIGLALIAVVEAAHRFCRARHHADVLMGRRPFPDDEQAEP